MRHISHNDFLLDLELMARRLLTEFGDATVILLGGEGNCRKASVAAQLCFRLEESSISACWIDIDDYANSRASRLREGFSGYDPRTFVLSRFNQDLRCLEKGQDIRKPFYDHATGLPCEWC